MDDRERQLERLRTLHASGALTDAEFELERARLALPPEGPPAPPAPVATGKRINPWLLIAPIAVIGLAVLAYFLIAGRSQQSAAVAANKAQADTSTAATPAAATMRSRPEAEQLAAASRAVFGQDGPVPRDFEGEQGSERAVRLVWTGFGPVLLTEASLPDGCHACSGFLGAYYLRDTGTGFEVTARHPEAAPGAGFGAAPADWRIVETYTTNPAIYYEGGYTGQGATSTFAHLVELRPDGPADSTIDLGYDDSAAGGDPAEASAYEGAIRDAVKDQGFEVAYTGTCAFTRRYVRRGTTFQPETDDAPECAN